MNLEHSLCELLHVSPASAHAPTTTVAPIAREQKTKVLAKTGKELQGDPGCPHVPLGPHVLLSHTRAHKGLRHSGHTVPAPSRTVRAGTRTHLKASAAPPHGSSVPHPPPPSTRKLKHHLLSRACLIDTSPPDPCPWHTSCFFSGDRHFTYCSGLNSVPSARQIHIHLEPQNMTAFGNGSLQK